MRKLRIVTIAGVMGLLIAGCSQEARDQYGQAGQDAGKAAEQTGKAAATDAENSKAAADNTLETAKVTSALNSAAGLDTKGINVDSDTEARTITLNGNVPNQMQKEQAETVAKGIAGNEFTVVNNLKVVGQ